MIVVVGEALVDLTLSADGALAAHLGGGPYNTARALGRLGVPVSYLGRLSTDAFGRRLRAALDADGVGLDSVLSTDDPTTLALAELDERGQASYRFYLDGTSVPGVEPHRALAALPADPAAVHVGTLALAVEPFARASEAVVERLAGRALVLVDPNVRPAIIRDRAAYLARLERVLARADVVKVSDEDLQWLWPGTPPDEAGRSVLALGPRLVLVTMGGAGALVLAREGVASVPAPVVAVVDTIGAGDTFAAGVLAWWHDNGRPDLGVLGAATEATRFAVQVAAVTVARAGADPPRRADLNLA
jgi:fructokinase